MYNTSLIFLQKQTVNNILLAYFDKFSKYFEKGFCLYCKAGNILSTKKGSLQSPVVSR
jgi:hypothetical protein